MDSLSLTHTGRPLFFCGLHQKTQSSIAFGGSVDFWISHVHSTERALLPLPILIFDSRDKSDLRGGATVAVGQDIAHRGVGKHSHRSYGHLRAMGGKVYIERVLILRYQISG